MKMVQRVRLLYVGSNANNGSACGLSASNANNAFSNSNANIGARLKFILNRKPNNTPLKTSQLGGIKPNMRKITAIPFKGNVQVGEILKARSVKMKAILT